MMPPQPQQIPPQPVPTLVQAGQTQSAEGNQVVLQFQTPVGLSVFFLSPPAAKQLGEQLVNLGAASNLLIAPAGAMPIAPGGS